VKTLLFYFKDHFIFSTKKIFHIIFFLFLCICILIFYQTGLHPWLNNPVHPDFIKFLFYFISYSFAYYFISFLYSYLHKNPRILTKTFYARSFTIIILLTFIKSSTIHAELVNRLVPVSYPYFLNRLLWLLKYPFAILLLLTGLYIFIGDCTRITGLRARNVNFKPFFLALMILIPFIFAVSYLPEFIHYYPKYRPPGNILSSGYSEILFSIPYEFSYGINLFSIEIIFRGLFVLLFIRYLGKGSVYPMVGVYCLFHLGKPPLECISSIFGGYILGVIALYSRSVLGGSMIHIGIAWSMELCAWLQHQINS
jgi:hypothetical protein